MGNCGPISLMNGVAIAQGNQPAKTYSEAEIRAFKAPVADLVVADLTEGRYRSIAELREAAAAQLCAAAEAKRCTRSQTQIANGSATESGPQGQIRVTEKMRCQLGAHPVDQKWWNGDEYPDDEDELLERVQAHPPSEAKVRRFRKRVRQGVAAEAKIVSYGDWKSANKTKGSHNPGSVTSSSGDGDDNQPAFHITLEEAYASRMDDNLWARPGLPGEPKPKDDMLRTMSYQQFAAEYYVYSPRQKPEREREGGPAAGASDSSDDGWGHDDAPGGLERELEQARRAIRERRQRHNRHNRRRNRNDQDASVSDTESRASSSSTDSPRAWDLDSDLEGAADEWMDACRDAGADRDAARDDLEVDWARSGVGWVGGEGGSFEGISEQGKIELSKMLETKKAAEAEEVLESLEADRRAVG
ncbi:hypothetical protein JKP88DRAFT_283357 [Tribonema minus]|uniref:Uncharacterized protein n=1 Tax=Tribonema minus TaxID=303371 RepID=A0A835YL71_9STRA|nr:hypothetical protein JKP88DRAFT_283357 [Tribonema minus]